MSDYYSHRDARQKGDQYLDYDTGRGAGWIWAVIILVAVVALVGLGATGGTGDGTATDAVVPAAADTSSIDGPAADVAPVGE